MTPAVGPPTEVCAWGRHPRTQSRIATMPSAAEAALPDAGPTLLPHGRARSYGDVALNDGGVLLATRSMDRFIDFDAATGRLRCESGATIDDLLRIAVPHGWFLPVTPGTRWASIGGCVANDVHGKNHHRAGSFGNHVSRLGLLRSDRGLVDCDWASEPALMRATVGGLGLTGLISTVELQLKPIAGAAMEVEAERFDTLDGFLGLSRAADRDWEYTVAWIDCLSARGGRLAGVFHRGRHAEAASPAPVAPSDLPAVPFPLPVSAVNAASLRIFNRLYLARAPSKPRLTRQHYQTYFYPLDRIPEWNRLYGRRGFVQHQCVVPPSAGDAMRAIFAEISKAGEGSMLAVLKVFGDVPSRGLLSFPRPGLTLALDFPIRGASTFELLERLDAIVVEAGGAVYPAKDARMSARTFAAGFPAAAEFERHRDPRFDSSFWRRVRGGESR